MIPSGVTFKTGNNGFSASAQRTLAAQAWSPELGEGRGYLGWGRGPQGLPCRMPAQQLLSFWPVDFLRNFFSQTLGLGTQKERLLDDLTLEGVARFMLSERCKSSLRWATFLLLALSDFSAPAT